MKSRTKSCVAASMLLAVTLLGCGAADTPDCTRGDAGTTHSDAEAGDASVEPPLSVFADRRELDFDLVCPGLDSPPLVLALANAGPDSVPIAARITGPDATAFHLVESGCDAPIPARGFCSLGVSVNPSDLVRVAAVLEIDAAAQRISVPLSARGADCWFARVEPMVARFPDAVLGEPTRMTFTIRALSGGLSDPVTMVEIRGADADQFEVERDGCLGHALLPSARCEIDVVMLATRPGAMSADLVVTLVGDTTAAMSGEVLPP